EEAGRRRGPPVIASPGGAAPRRGGGDGGGLENWGGEVGGAGPPFAGGRGRFDRRWRAAARCSIRANGVLCAGIGRRCGNDAAKVARRRGILRARARRGLSWRRGFFMQRASPASSV